MNIKEEITNTNQEIKYLLKIEETIGELLENSSTFQYQKEIEILYFFTHIHVKMDELVL